LNFRKLLSGAQKGEVIIPVLRAALFDPNFKDFQVRVGGFKKRKPDGWFHPSEHPLWPERMLYHYVANPESMVSEPFDPHSTMAVTQGQFWHTFVSKVGMEAHVLTAENVPVQDNITGARGEMDGLLEAEVFEFKTMRPMKAAKLPDLPVNHPDLLAFYADRQPGYYAQAQEYMRMSGYTHCRTLVLSLEYPFDWREILIPRDEEFIYAVREKYLRVRQSIADKRSPQPCCAPGSKEAHDCPARLVCPVGMA
jgi:hypothetical protein